jgi:predicted MFS family arabinose efflux permease
MTPPRAVATAFGGLLAVAAGIGIGRFVYTPILPPMVEALGLSKSQAGLIASANFLGYLLGALLAALPTLPGARRTWLLAALALSAVTTAAMGVSATLPAFLVLRFVGGIASAFVLILASTEVLEHLVEIRRRGLSALHFAGVGSGIAVSAALVATLLRLGQPWQNLWLASGALSLAAVLAVAALLPGRAAPTRPLRPPQEAVLDPDLRRLIIAYGLFGFGYIITATFLVAIVRGTPAISALEPVIWIVFGLAAAPSIALWSRIAGRFGIPSAFALACLVEAAGVLASIAWPTPGGVLLAAVLVGGTFVGITALGLVRAQALVTGDPRRALALMTCAFGLGQIIGPLFAGIVSDRLGDFTLPSVVAVAALLAAAVLARQRGSAERHATRKAEPLPIVIIRVLTCSRFAKKMTDRGNHGHLHACHGRHQRSRQGSRILRRRAGAARAEATKGSWRSRLVLGRDDRGIHRVDPSRREPRDLCQWRHGQL